MTGPSKPNLVLMHSHNTGRFVEPYGHAIPAPNLQQLVNQGVLFSSAFATAPTCSPSHASFLSGKYPHSCGMLGLAHRGFAMSDYAVHLAHTLKQHGYQTILAGVEHTAPDPTTVGCDRILSTSDTNYPSLLDTPDPVAAVCDLLAGPHEMPIFLSLGLNATHRPFPPPDPPNHPSEDARYCAVPPSLPDNLTVRADMAAFKAAVREMDDAYGAVLAALDHAGLAEGTLVCCFSDHGLQFPMHMCNLLDAGIGVYLILRGPGFTGGRVVDQVVSLIDLAATLYEAAEIACPPHVQRQSLRATARDGAEPLHAEVFAENNFHAAYEPMRCVRTSRHKYIRRFDGRSRMVLPNVDHNPIKDLLLEQGWFDQGRDEELLFDLLFDPQERCDQVGNPAKADILDELRRRLHDWMVWTNDPLINSRPVPAPAGAYANDPDDLSPSDQLHLV